MGLKPFIFFEGTVADSLSNLMALLFMCIFSRGISFKVLFGLQEKVRKYCLFISTYLSLKAEKGKGKKKEGSNGFLAFDHKNIIIIR